MLAFSGKTVLVTGATGLIGSHVVKAMLDMGDVRVIALSRSEEKLRQSFASYLANPNFSYCARDISCPLDVLQEPIHFIFHAAGPISAETIKNAPLQVISPNIVGTEQCLEFLCKQERETGIRGRIIIFSSATVYGNISNKDRRVTELDTEITDSLHSINAPYSQAKRMCEVVAQSYCKQYGIDVVVVRFSYVYGYTKCQPPTAFFEFINKAVLGKDIVLNGSGFARRDNIYIDDAISALICVAENGALGEVYNISSNAEQDNYAAIDEIAAVIAKIANQQNKTQFGASVKVVFSITGQENIRTPGLILDNTKLKLLGWRLKVNLAQGIECTILQSQSVSKV